MLTINQSAGATLLPCTALQKSESKEPE